MSFKRGSKWFMRPRFLGEDSIIKIRAVKGDRVRIYDCWIGKSMWVSRGYIKSFYYPVDLRLLARSDMEELTK